MNLQTKGYISIETFPAESIIKDGQLTPEFRREVEKQFMMLGKPYKWINMGKGIEVVWDWDSYFPCRLFRLDSTIENAPDGGPW